MDKENASPYPSNPTAVIFDMDGVLVDSEPLHARCYVEIFGRHGLHCTVERYLNEVTRGHKDVRDLYIAVGGDMDKWPDAMAAKIVRMKELVTTDWTPMPGVVSLLRELEEARVPTAIVTAAGWRSVNFLLDKFDLRRYFKEFVTWHDVTATKPDPEGFLIAAAKLGVKPEQSAVIEDSPRGVLAASRAGMKCIAVPTASTADGDFSLATLVVESLEEVTLETLSGLFDHDIEGNVL